MKQWADLKQFNGTEGLLGVVQPSTMLIDFQLQEMWNWWQKFNIKSLICYDLCGIIIPSGQTVYQTYYKEILIKTRERIRKKPSFQFKNQSWLLHHDDAPAQSTLSIREFLADKKMSALPRHSYLPDLALCDFILFLKNKIEPKRQRFYNI